MGVIQLLSRGVRLGQRDFTSKYIPNPALLLSFPSSFFQGAQNTHIHAHTYLIMRKICIESYQQIYFNEFVLRKASNEQRPNS